MRWKSGVLTSVFSWCVRYGQNRQLRLCRPWHNHQRSTVCQPSTCVSQSWHVSWEISLWLRRKVFCPWTSLLKNWGTVTERNCQEVK